MSGVQANVAQEGREAVGIDANPIASVAQAGREAVGIDASPIASVAQAGRELAGAIAYQPVIDLAWWSTVQSAPERPFPLGFKDYPPPPVVARFGATGPFL